MSIHYDVKNISVQITTSDGEIYDIETRHSEGLGDDPAGETTSEVTSNTGEKVYNVTPDEGTTFTLSLLYGSQEDKIMEFLYKKYKSRKGTFFFNAIVRDENIGQTVRYTTGSFTKRTAHKWGNTSGTDAKVWELKFEKKNVDND